jgi:hypothetical protein
MLTEDKPDEISARFENSSLPCIKDLVFKSIITNCHKIPEIEAT